MTKAGEPTGREYPALTVKLLRVETTMVAVAVANASRHRAAFASQTGTAATPQVTERTMGT
jgi:hypothetical protein